MELRMHRMNIGFERLSYTTQDIKYQGQSAVLASPAVREVIDCTAQRLGVQQEPRNLIYEYFWYLGSLAAQEHFAYNDVRWVKRMYFRSMTLVVVGMYLVLVILGRDTRVE